MRIAELAKRNNEMFVAQRFVRWRTDADEDLGELTFGVPPQTDVLWHRGAWTGGIEIADAYFGGDARELFGSLRERIPAADAFSTTRPIGVLEAGFLTASSSHGMPDLTIPRVVDPLPLIIRLGEVGREHCKTSYAPADRLFLILNAGSRPLLRPNDAETFAARVQIDDRGPFDEVFVCVTLTEDFDRKFIRIL